ncbi:MAG: hypothetical protein WBA40_14220 [Roseiarcus sp.]
MRDHAKCSLIGKAQRWPVSEAAEEEHNAHRGLDAKSKALQASLPELAPSGDQLAPLIRIKIIRPR